MHPLGYLLDLRRARTPYLQQAVGLIALFAVPCLALSLANPDVGAGFLIISALAMTMALPLYQARSHLSLLSSLRRSHCLEELLGCGLQAQACADQLTRHAVLELVRLTAPVLVVLIPGTLLAGPEMRAYLVGMILWLPVMVYLTALGSYTACLQMAWTGGWRKKLRLLTRWWPLVVPPALLVAALGMGNGFLGLLTLLAGIIAARSLAADTLDLTVREEPERPAGARWRNRWVTSWSDNPIVVRESWRRSSVPGGLAGYVALRFLSVALPLGWILLVFECRTRGVFWGGAFLLTLFYAARAGQRALSAVVGEREQATWDTLAQTGLSLRTFIVGWVQVASFPVLLESLTPAFFSLVLAWAFPAAVTPESWSQQASSWESMLLVTLGFGAGAALVTAFALGGLALSTSSRSLRQATGRGFGALAMAVVAWLGCWGLGAAVLDTLALRGWVQADSHTWVTVLQVVLPMASVVILSAWSARYSWRNIHAHLSLEEWPEPAPHRWSLVHVGGLIFFATCLWATRQFQMAICAALVGVAAGRLVEWWWAPLLKAWRGQNRVVALWAGLAAALVGLAFLPLLLKYWTAGPYYWQRSLLAGLNPPRTLLTALPLAALLGAWAALGQRELEPEPGGDFGRRTLAVAVLAFLLHPLVLQLI